MRNINDNYDILRISARRGKFTAPSALKTTEKEFFSTQKLKDRFNKRVLSDAAPNISTSRWILKFKHEASMPPKVKDKEWRVGSSEMTIYPSCFFPAHKTNQLKIKIIMKGGFL